jgi:hypothetical protein
MHAFVCNNYSQTIVFPPFLYFENTLGTTLKNGIPNFLLLSGVTSFPHETGKLGPTISRGFCGHIPTMVPGTWAKELHKGLVTKRCPEDFGEKFEIGFFLNIIG